jgi:hypothetical protein
MGYKVYCDSVGKPQPEVIVWSGDVLRIQDQLPPTILGKDWKGGKRNKIRFTQIADVETKLYIVLKRTHWGKTLCEIASNKTHVSWFWAKTLKDRIKAFLRGNPDPLWSKRHKEKVGGKPLTASQLRSRSVRLIEVLKTIDGIFTERYLARPCEVWTWEKFDLHTLWNLSYLIGDEFYDGVINEYVINLTSSYATLKSARGVIKSIGHRQGSDEELEERWKTFPPWLNFLFLSFVEVRKLSGVQYLSAMNYLSQTRGCGTPPPLVMMQSKMKFLRTVSSDPDSPSQGQLKIVEEALERVIQSIPDHHFTGLTTKAAVTVTGSASWEDTRRDGGTCESIRDIVLMARSGMKAKVINLHTGLTEGFQTMEELGEGSYVFWKCLEVVLATPLERLRDAYLVVVSEPGKGRSVTKARACLKIVLDVVNKLASWPLGKGLESSHSGMQRANQGWNLFQSIFTDRLEELVFAVERRETEEFAGYTEIRETYKTVYVSSTDYEEATDKMDHKVASLLGMRWMTKCGIPPILRGIVAGTCYNPRNIFFKSQKGDVLEQLGKPEPDGSRSVKMYRGVLMGDPLTKVVLHLLNATVREIGRSIHTEPFLRRLVDNPFELSEKVSKILGKR